MTARDCTLMSGSSETSRLHCEVFTVTGSNVRVDPNRREAGPGHELGVAHLLDHHGLGGEGHRGGARELGLCTEVLEAGT